MAAFAVPAEGGRTGGGHFRLRDARPAVLRAARPAVLRAPVRKTMTKKMPRQPKSKKKEQKQLECDPTPPF